MNSRVSRKFREALDGKSSQVLDVVTFGAFAGSATNIFLGGLLPLLNGIVCKHTWSRKNPKAEEVNTNRGV
jgi:hypothetical protein